MIGFVGCDSKPKTSELNSGKVEKKVFSAESIARIDRFCSDCHKMPDPTTFPKSRWPEEVLQGYNFYVDSLRTDLDEPDRLETIKYFQANAPDVVIVPRADAMESPVASTHFELTDAYQAIVEAPATAQVQWVPKSKSLLFTNMRNGELHEWQAIPRSDSDTSPKAPKLIAAGSHICRATICDWNQDGVDDYLLGEMGSFPVGDHDKGRISLLIGNSTGNTTPTILMDKVSRVVEAKPFDFDEDGDMDVIAADFGWRKTGGLRLLKNVGGTPDKPEMESVVLDPRHGPLGIEIADMNGDGKKDYLVAYGQEFESIELNLNRGPGKYDRQVIVSLADPSYNMSAFQVVDLDLDGKLDVVYSCGDTMDALLAKPYHGIGWVKNMGDDKFEHHWLGLMVGALQPTVADLDGDGDLDIAAVGMFPGAKDEPKGTFDSICWWEQCAGLEFVRHSIEQDRCTYASCTTADINGDGRLDLVVGEWLIPNSSAFRVYLNQPTESPLGTNPMASK